jgi:hypothetical protein
MRFKSFAEALDQFSADDSGLSQGTKFFVVSTDSLGKERLADGTQCWEEEFLLDLEVRLEVARERLKHLFPHILGRQPRVCATGLLATDREHKTRVVVI